jgi:thiosulfate/3-mercaptopyruvate sulfurtransferase
VSLWLNASSLLVDPPTLKTELARVRVVDLRDSEDAYKRGHIPGAVYLSIRDLDDLEANKRGMPVTLDKAQAVFARLGLNKDTQVVAYDDAGGRNAARLFYFLEFFGHPKVRILDGGFPRWLKEGGEVTAEIPTITAGKARPKIKNKHFASADRISEKQRKNKVQVIDTRTAEEFAGNARMPGRPGHIPGAVNLVWQDLLAPDGRFKSVAELQKLIAAKGITKNQECVTYCNSGVRASGVYVILRMLGYNKARLYDGSWQEWGPDEKRPVAK